MAITQTLPGVSPLASPLIQPATALLGTQFYSPLVSGAPGQVMGSAQLAYRFDVDFSTGSFDGNAPGAQLQFPPGTILFRLVAAVLPIFTAAGSVVNFGTTATGAQIGSIDLTAAGFQEEVPNLVPANGIVYVSLVMGASIAGHASIAILYLGAPNAPWS